MSTMLDDSREKNANLEGGLLKTCLFLFAFVGLSAVGCHELNTRYGAQIDTFLQSHTNTNRDTFAPVASIERVGVLKRRSTLYETLTGMGADVEEAQNALQSLYDRELVDPRRVIAGMTITANFTRDDNQLLSVSFSPENGRQVFTKRLASNDYFASALSVQSRPSIKRVAATISTSLYEAALEAGATDQQVADFAQIFAFDIDFQREIQVGDEFEILYETLVDERGNFVSSGEVLFASLNGRVLERSFYRHTPIDDNIVDYFTAETLIQFRASPSPDLRLFTVAQRYRFCSPLRHTNFCRRQWCRRTRVQIWRIWKIRPYSARKWLRDGIRPHVALRPGCSQRSPCTPRRHHWICRLHRCLHWSAPSL